MLSRVADSIYWMSRYVERAENVARFIEVNLQLMLDAPDGQDQQWQPLVNITGDHEDFAKRCGAPTQPNVIEFLAFDPVNPNSILSCLRAARENARTVREIISSEMWLQLNKFYLMVNSAAERRGTYASNRPTRRQIAEARSRRRPAGMPAPAAVPDWPGNDFPVPARGTRRARGYRRD